MTDRSVTHATFTLERRYRASPARVFRAFADFEEKRKWFGSPPGWRQMEAHMDFRVGGREVNACGPEGGFVSTFNSLYQDIVTNERIVYTYEMLIDGARISVSLATFEFRPDGNGTELVLTEQGAYLDGADTPDQRQAGTVSILDALGQHLETDRT